MPIGVYKRTLEHNKKNSEAKKKNPVRYWYGKKRAPFTEEQKRKMSETHKKMGISPELRIKLIKGRIGSKRAKATLETRQKMSVSHRGSKNYNWRGGKALRESIRGCLKYIIWRESIFKRDKFTCVMCGSLGSKLNVDHYPKTFQEIKESNFIRDIESALLCGEFWDINNGRTLCIECHRKTDTWGIKSTQIYQKYTQKLLTVE